MWATRAPLPSLFAKVFVLFCFSLLFYVAQGSGIGKALVNPIDHDLAPLSASLTKLRFTVAFSAFSSADRNKLTAKNTAFATSQNNLAIAQLQIANLEAENQTLRQKLGLLPAVKPTLQLGHIITIGQTIIVQVDGPATIPNGTLVTVDDNVVGTVIGQLSDTIYEVMPTVDPNYKAKVLVIHQGTSVDGIVQGQFSNYLELTNVLSTATIANGDFVVLNDASMPSAGPYVIGKISQVEKDATQVFHQAQVVPLFDLQSQRTVFFEEK